MSDERPVPKAPDPLRPARVFGWGTREMTPWEKSIPPTTLIREIASLHALLLDLGAEGDVLKTAERHLNDIAIYTQYDPTTRGKS